jgi:hypothetical protein
MPEVHDAEGRRSKRSNERKKAQTSKREVGEARSLTTCFNYAVGCFGILGTLAGCRSEHLFCKNAPLLPIIGPTTCQRM